MIANIIVFPGSNCDRDIKVALEKFQVKCKMKPRIQLFENISQLIFFFKDCLQLLYDIQ